MIQLKNLCTDCLDTAGAELEILLFKTESLSRIQRKGVNGLIDLLRTARRELVSFNDFIAYIAMIDPEGIKDRETGTTEENSPARLLYDLCFTALDNKLIQLLT